MNRLRTCLCALALATLFASPAAARQGLTEPRTAELRDAGDPALQRGLERVVRDLGLDADVRARRLSLAVVDVTEPAAPRLAMLNGDEMVYAASLPKVAILLGACVEAEAGRLPLDESRRAAMVNMIRYSSNEDATRVLRWVGEQRLLEILQSDRFRFYEPNGAGGLWVGKAYGGEGAYRRDPLRNLSHGATAYQVARLYYELAAGRLLSPDIAEVMKDALSRPGIRHKFVKGLESRPGATIYRKSGTWRDFHADSALVEHGRHRYVLVGLAEHAQGGDWLARLAAPLHDLVVQPGRMALAGR